MSAGGRRGPRMSAREIDRMIARDKAEAKAMLGALVVPTHIVASCCKTGDECCQHYVGIEAEWAQKLLGLLSPIVGMLYETADQPRAESVDGHAASMAIEKLRKIVHDINDHIGGAPRFPVSYPLIDGKDRDWMLEQRKIAVRRGRKAA